MFRTGSVVKSRSKPTLTPSLHNVTADVRRLMPSFSAAPPSFLSEGRCFCSTHFLGVLLLAAGVFPQIAALAAENTNQAALAYPPPALNLEISTRSQAFVTRFFEEVTSSDSTLFDRFTGPSPKLDWTRRRETLGYGVLERWNSAGASMFGSIGMDSFRTVAIELLPLDRWADFWQGHLLNFIANSIGRPEEQHIELISSSYSAVRTSWESGNLGTGLTWGVRPWGTTPYLYFLAQAGHLDGRSLVTLEGRAQYTVLGSTKLEGRLTFQLPASFRLAAGTSIDPSCIGSHAADATPHIAVTLERAIRTAGTVPDGVFFIGFRSRVSGNSSNPHQENLLIAGLSKRW